MDRSNIRYEVLSGEDENTPAEPVNLTMVVPPPAYSETTQETTVENSPHKDDSYTAKLPSYVDATTLPSYEEAERAKQREADNMCETQQEMSHDRFTGMTIGTDGMFLVTFVLSFFFNWIGFLLSLCLTNTVAGRCGALSGLGLSIVKWVAIVKHNNWATGFAEEDSWIWWLLMLCGFMIFIRGAIHYAKIKYEWNKLTAPLRNHYYFSP